MNFREMADEMRENEVNTVLKIIYPDARMLNFTRHRDTNYISVIYSFPQESNKELKLKLLPDDVYIIGDGQDLDAEPVGTGSVLYQYEQFMIARGYSEYWKNNYYSETKN